MNGPVAITSPLIQEVLAAVEAVRTPNNRLVSRSRIEDEIADNPGKYPVLSQTTRTFRRQVITKVMKRRFEFWSPERRNTFVWNITAPMEASA